MLDMNQPTPPIPNPTDWMTIAAVAFLLGVHRRSVTRLVEKGTLKSYRPYGAAGETAPVMFWRPAVEALVDARTVLAGTGDR